MQNHTSPALSLSLPSITPHAQQRMAQRNVMPEHIQFVLDHGIRYHAAGSLHVYLRRKDIPQQYRKQSPLMRLEGTNVVLCRHGATVLTVWRNRQKGNKHIKRKPNFER